MAHWYTNRHFFQVLATAPRILNGYRERLDELEQPRADLSRDWAVRITQCETELARLQNTGPPHLLHPLMLLGPFSPAGQALVPEIRRRMARVAARAQQENAVSQELSGVIEGEGEDDPVWTWGKWAELSLLIAKRCDSEVALRRVETQLWQTGSVRFLPAPNYLGISYQLARATDPGFSTLCDAYTQIAALYRQKAAVETQLADGERQKRGIVDKYERVHSEYKRIGAEEGLG